MNKRHACMPLLWLGIAGLLLALLGGIYIGPNSASKIEARLDSNVQKALRDAGYADWAQPRQLGQKVVLAGQAPSEEQKSAALQTALQAVGRGGVLRGGVTKVVDRIEVAPLVSPYVWGASKTGDTIILTGHAPTTALMNEIVSTAKSRYGGRVVNEMELASGATGDAGWIDMVRLGLSQLEGLEPGEVRFENSNMTVTGSAKSIDTVADIENALVAVAHPFSASSLVDGPYQWAARLDGDSMILAGGVRDDSVRNQMLRTAKLNFDGEIVDKMIVDKRTGWEKTGILALEHLSRFKTGEAKLVDNTFFFTGEASESAFEYLTEDMKSLPRPYSAQIDVNTIAPRLSELAGVDLNVEGDEKKEACQEAFMRLMTGNRIYFATASSNIDRKSGETLDKLIVVARNCADMSITIEGHSDDRGSRDLNLELSDARANAVRRYFIARGLPEDNLSAVGYGPDRPADTNDTPEGRKNNRRIEFKVAIEEDR